MATEIKDATFESDVLQSEIPVLLDFWAPWCGPCQALGPTIELLAKEFEGKVLVAKLNVDENPATPAKFNIRGIPTLLLFKNGNMVERIVGAQSKEDLVKFLNDKALA